MHEQHALAVPVADAMASASSRAGVERLQAEVSKLPQYEPQTTNHFHGGMYCREVWRQAGALVVGKVHKREHFYLVASGVVWITTDAGPQRVVAPCLMLSKPGTKRAVYAETDALCMTFHRTDALDVDAAEADLVEDDPGAMYAAGNRLPNAVEFEPVGVLS